MQLGVGNTYQIAISPTISLNPYKLAYPACKLSMCIRISSLDGINTRLVIIPYLGVRIRNMIRVDNFMQAASPIFSRRCVCATDVYKYIARLSPQSSGKSHKSFIIYY